MNEIKPVTKRCQWYAHRIVIVGCGGIGSHLWDMVARELYNRAGGRAEVRRVLLVDADVVEQKNLGRQSFGVSDIGLSKAEALARRYRRNLGDRNIHVDAVKSWLSNESEILNEKDVILLCVDNNKTRKMLNDLMLNEQWFDVCAINGGNRDHLVTTHIMIKNDGHVVTAPFEHMQPDITNPQDRHPSEIPCSEAGAIEQDPQVFRANQMAATLMFNDCMNVIDGNEIQHCAIWADVGKMNFRKEPIPASQDDWIIANVD